MKTVIWFAIGVVLGALLGRYWPAVRAWLLETVKGPTDGGT